MIQSQPMPERDKEILIAAAHNSQDVAELLLNRDPEGAAQLAKKKFPRTPINLSYEDIDALTSISAKKFSTYLDLCFKTGVLRRPQ